jgi:hypothetical protein
MTKLAFPPTTKAQDMMPDSARVRKTAVFILPPSLSLNGMGRRSLGGTVAGLHTDFPEMRIDFSTGCWVKMQGRIIEANADIEIEAGVKTVVLFSM